MHMYVHMYVHTYVPCPELHHISVLHTHTTTSTSSGNYVVRSCVHIHLCMHCTVGALFRILVCEQVLSKQSSTSTI